MAKPWATLGFDLHLEPAGPGLRRGLTGALREAVRTGRLAPGTRLPSSRTLAADLGVALGGGAHLRNLRRTRAGSFDVADAHRIDEIDPETHVLTPAEALRDLPTVVVDVPTAVDVGHGRPLERSRLGIPEEHAGPWAVESQDGVLLAVYGPHREGTVKPEVVLA